MQKFKTIITFHISGCKLYICTLMWNWTKWGKTIFHTIRRVDYYTFLLKWLERLLNSKSAVFCLYILLLKVTFSLCIFLFYLLLVCITLLHPSCLYVHLLWSTSMQTHGLRYCECVRNPDRWLDLGISRTAWWVLSGNAHSRARQIKRATGESEEVRRSCLSVPVVRRRSPGRCQWWVLIEKTVANDCQNLEPLREFVKVLLRSVVSHFWGLNCREEQVSFHVSSPSPFSIPQLERVEGPGLGSFSALLFYCV